MKWTTLLLGVSLIAAAWSNDAIAQQLPPHPAGKRPYTEDAIWTPKYEELTAHCGVTDAAFLNPDDPTQANCILDDMQKNGASPQAQQFFQDTHYFLSDFHALSPVIDFGHASAPWVDMSRAQPLFLNGTPPAIWPDYDSSAFTDLQNDPLHSDFFANHPYASPWSTYATLTTSRYGPNGGQVVTLSEPVRDCRACDDLADLWVTFTFDAAGNVIGTDVGPLVPPT